MTVVVVAPARRTDCIEVTTMNDSSSAWSEQDSLDFIDLAHVAVPGRREQMEVLLSLIPAGADEEFRAVDVCCGEGFLLARLLERFPMAQVLGLDGSDTMLAAADKRLARFGRQVELRSFDLGDPAWPREAGRAFRCVLSSLAFHHLTPEGKRRLFRELRERLEPGGALLIADVTEPASPTVWRSVSATWHRIAREQSLAASGALDLYERAVAEGWAPPEEQPQGETPSRLYEQLRWLEEAGFSVVDCFWMRAGIAIFGGYR